MSLGSLWWNAFQNKAAAHIVCERVVRTITFIVSMYVCIYYTLLHFYKILLSPLHAFSILFSYYFHLSSCIGGVQLINALFQVSKWKNHKYMEYFGWQRYIIASIFWKMIFCAGNHAYSKKCHKQCIVFGNNEKMLVPRFPTL